MVGRLDSQLQEALLRIGLAVARQIAFRHRLQLPSDLVMLFRVSAISEGLGAQLDPDFRLFEFAAPYIQRFWLEFSVNHAGLSEFTRQLQRMTNRLALTMLLSAIVVSLGLVMLVYHLPGWEQIAGWVFALAFLLALGFGVWLMWSIWRAGR